MPPNVTAAARCTMTDEVGSIFSASPYPPLSDFYARLPVAHQHLIKTNIAKLRMNPPLPKDEDNAVRVILTELNMEPHTPLTQALTGTLLDMIRPYQASLVSSMDDDDMSLLTSEFSVSSLDGNDDISPRNHLAVSTQSSFNDFFNTITQSGDSSHGDTLMQFRDTVQMPSIDKDSSTTFKPTNFPPISQASIEKLLNINCDDTLDDVSNDINPPSRGLHRQNAVPDISFVHTFDTDGDTGEIHRVPCIVQVSSFAEDKSDKSDGRIQPRMNTTLSFENEVFPTQFLLGGDMGGSSNACCAQDEPQANATLTASYLSDDGTVPDIFPLCDDVTGGFPTGVHIANDFSTRHINIVSAVGASSCQCAGQHKYNGISDIDLPQLPMDSLYPPMNHFSDLPFGYSSNEDACSSGRSDTSDDTEDATSCDSDSPHPACVADTRRKRSTKPVWDLVGNCVCSGCNLTDLKEHIESGGKVSKAVKDFFQVILHVIAQRQRHQPKPNSACKKGKRRNSKHGLCFDKAHEGKVYVGVKKGHSVGKIVRELMPTGKWKFSLHRNRDHFQK